MIVIETSKTDVRPEAREHESRLTQPTDGLRAAQSGEDEDEDEDAFFSCNRSAPKGF